MTRIKFCGLTRVVDAAHAARLGASHVGVILASGPRKVTPALAGEIFSSAPGLRHVGVFRHAPVADILRDSELAGVDVIQLHARFGTADLAHLRESFDGELWTVAPVDTDRPELPEDLGQLVDMVDALLLDTSVRGESGGTGVPFDWPRVEPLVRDIAARTTIVLAGGLDPENVRSAIAALSPDIVDVSSGVESAPGIKDPILMQAFAEAVRSASIV